ncbi:MAG: peptidyl-prolyl cis-trans isomerase [Candidatus Omnitrophota bacterium]
MGRMVVTVTVIAALALLSGCDKMPQWLSVSKPKPVVAQPKAPEVKGTILASINGRNITLEEFNAYIEAYNAEIQASTNIPEDVRQNYLLKNKEDKMKILDSMVERELMIAEAVDRGYAKEEQVSNALKALEEQLLFARLVEAERSKTGITREEIEGYYNMYRDAFAIPEERKISLIVVAGEDQAKEILIQLLQGANFGVLASQYSSDEKSKSQGGDIGFIIQQSPLRAPDEQMAGLEKLQEVAFSLELNKPSAIFQGPNGYYIIKVTEIKPASQKSLDEVYSDIEQGLLMRKQEEALKTLLGNLRSSGNIVVNEQLLGN